MENIGTTPKAAVDASFGHDSKHHGNRAIFTGRRVRVSITGATPAKKNIDHFFRSPGDVNLFMSEIEPVVLTDDEGRFAFHHAPMDYRMSMVIDHPAFAREFFVVDTGKDRGLSEIGIGEQGVDNPMKWAMIHLPLEMSLRPGLHYALVKVTDSTGKAVTSGTVTAEDGSFNTVALSATGEARLRIAKQGLGKNRFRYAADPLDPALSVSTSAEIAESGETLIELRLPEPLWLTGKVVNPETKQGVVGAAVFYGSAAPDGGGPVGTRTISGQGGAFKIPVVAGKGTMRIFGPIHRYVVPSYFSADGKSPAPGLSISRLLVRSSQ